MNLLTHFNYNKNKVLLSLPSCYEALKEKVKEGTFNSSATMVSPAPYSVCGNVAILDFKGFTVSSASELEEAFYGVISLQDFCDDLEMAVEDDSVSSIIINFDSGGGYTMYGDETCALIKSLNEIKPIYAYTSGYMCSMAYKVASNCASIVASPTALVGSIGAYVEYEDDTKALDMAGIVIKTFQGGSEKTIGSPFISLTHEQEVQIQEDINNQWEAFKALVVSNRGNVSDEVMQGQAFTAQKALEQDNNLIDGCINSLKQFVQLISEQSN